MLVLKNEFNEIITHPYFKYEDTLENKKDFSKKLYQFFFHVRDIVYSIGNKKTIGAIERVMHDWIRYARNIGYYEDINLTIQEKFDVASYLNIVFREIGHFIATGEFNTVTKGKTIFYVPEYPLYPQYRYCKVLDKWKLYLPKEDIKTLYRALETKFSFVEPNEYIKNIILSLKDDYNSWNEYWGNDENKKL